MADDPAPDDHGNRRRPSAGVATGAGIAVGAGVGVALFAASGNPVWIGVFAGIGVVIGSLFTDR